MKYAKSVGPPGTGKTTYLLKQIERDCDRYFHRKIGAVSLTTAAVSEIRGRIARHLDIKKEDAENVRTIHSHCYKLLNMRKDGVAETSANIKKFNQMWPQLAINGGGGDDITEYAAAKHHNQQAFNDMQNYRNRMIPVDSWKNPLAVKMNDAWTSFMNENDLTDFTGMLERALSISEAPDMDVIYIDECQDTSVLAMNVLMKWAAGTQKAVFIGDTDQALFRFSGAVPEVFGNLKTDWSSSLKQSYRVPEKVHEFAMKIIRKIPGRADVEYIPYNEHAYNMINESGGNAPQWYKGAVFKTAKPDLTLPGTHMILGRTNRTVHKYVAELRHKAIPFHNPYRPDDNTWNPSNQSAWRVAVIYHKLTECRDITVNELKALARDCIAKQCFTKKGVKKQISEMPDNKEMITFFDLMSLGFSENFTDKKIPPEQCLNIKSKSADMIFSILKNAPEKLYDSPNVILGTIHSVKGGEADHVWIDCEMSYPIMKALKTRQPPYAFADECRCFYVAATRARQTVGIMNHSANPILRGIRFKFH